MRALFVCVLLALTCVQASAQQFFSTYRPVATLNPHVRAMREQGASDEQIARVLATYDAVIMGQSVFNQENMPMLTRVKQIKPRAIFTLMWAAWKQDCSLIGTQPAALVTFLKSIGRDQNKIDFIEIDGGGTASSPKSGCDTTELFEALADYRTALDRAGYQRIRLIANGAKYPTVDEACRYHPANDSRGYLTRSTHKNYVGRIQEGWSRYFDPSKNTVLNGMLAEMCAWSQATDEPHFSVAYGKCDTPWWHEREGPYDWRCARLSFVLSQMFDDVAFIMTPADTDVWGSVTTSRLYRLDYFAWNKNTNRPPAYGDLSTPLDDELGEVMATRGYLGAPQGPMQRQGSLRYREFACGYLVGNIGNKPRVFRPDQSTQQILGWQGGFDDGTSAAAYEIPPHDAKLLIKNRRPACFNQALVRAKKPGVWRYAAQ
jgi:hypothetical protein